MRAEDIPSLQIDDVLENTHTVGTVFIRVLSRPEHFLPGPRGWRIRVLLNSGAEFYLTHSNCSAWEPST